MTLRDILFLAGSVPNDDWLKLLDRWVRFANATSEKELAEAELKEVIEELGVGQ